MAGDEDKTVVEGKGGEGQEASPKKKGSNKLILFGGIGVGAIVIGVALTIFVIKPMTSGSNAGEEQNTEEVSKDTHAKKEDSHGGKSEGEEGGGNLCTIKDIVINPAGTGGSRFLSVSFAFELDSPSDVTLFESREPAIRDALITILSSKTVAQLTDPKQKEIARYQIKKRVAQLMKLEEIAGVYYTDFVLQ
ncbi:MAG: flagellar basal body-associated FliL family protein [bacterium]